MFSEVIAKLPASLAPLLAARLIWLLPIVNLPSERLCLPSFTKISVKLVFPLVLCFFPAFYVVVLGPAIVQFVRAFIK